MKPTIFKLKTYLLMGFCISICLASCTDTHNDLGVNINPDNERLLVRHDSSATIKAYSVHSDHLIQPTNGDALLGHIHDPLIGSYRSSFIANAYTSVTGVELGDSAIIDSMFLYLKYDEVFGEYDHEHSFSVYELYLDTLLLVSNLDTMPDDISSIQSYYDPSRFLGKVNYTPKVANHDSVYIEPIRLDLLQTHQGMDLAKRMVLSSDTVYTLPKYLQQYVFNGLFVEAEDRNLPGGMIRVLGSDSSRVVVYFRTIDSAGVSDPASIAFNLNTKSRANIYDRNLKSDLPIYEPDFEPEAEEIEDTTFYLLGINGIEGRVVVDIASIFSDITTPVAINRAFMTIEVVDSSLLDVETYPIMPSIKVYADDPSDPYLTEFYGYNSTTGTYYYNAVNYNNGAYSFLATSRVVKAFNEGKDKFTLRLVSGNNHFDPSRVALRGQGNKTYPIKIKISYTVLNSN